MGERRKKGLHIFLCPVYGKTKADYNIDAIDYRGPKGEPLEYKRDEPIGADRKGNHRDKGGNILLIDLSVREMKIDVTEAPEDSALWKKADETTCE